MKSRILPRVTDMPEKLPIRQVPSIVEETNGAGAGGL
jgi:hypothetical protein